MFMTLDDLDQTSAALVNLARSEHVPKAKSVQIYSPAHHFQRGAQSSQNASFLFKISVSKTMFLTLDDLDQTSASLIKLCKFTARHIIFDAVHSLCKMPVSYSKLV